MAARATTRRLRLQAAARENDVLRTWGEIAGVLCISVRTAMTWRHRYGLPVFKPPGAMNSTVVASRRAVLVWFSARYGKQPGKQAAG